MKIKDIIHAAGGYRKLAKELGIAPSSVFNWRRVPATRVLKISQLTGIAPDLIRPDVFKL